jgi:hypothetical protein
LWFFFRLEYFAPGVAEISNSFGISTLASNYTGLDETKNYTFRLYVQNDAGWSTYAEVVQQVLPICVRPKYCDHANVLSILHELKYSELYFMIAAY